MNQTPKQDIPTPMRIYTGNNISLEITDGSSIFTLLNGTITVTDDITGAV